MRKSSVEIYLTTEDFFAGTAMSIIDFIAVVSFGLTCFGLGYSIGSNSNKTTKK